MIFKSTVFIIDTTVTVLDILKICKKIYILWCFIVLFLFLWKSILYNNTNTLINIHAWCMYIDKGTRISQWELVSFVIILSEKTPKNYQCISFIFTNKPNKHIQRLSKNIEYMYNIIICTYTKVIKKNWIHVQHNTCTYTKVKKAKSIEYIYNIITCTYTKVILYYYIHYYKL